MKHYLKILFFISFLAICIIASIKIYYYYSPAKERQPYFTIQHNDDTIRIAYIGDSWAFGHKNHECKIENILSNKLSRNVIVSSYGIGGLTSKEIYNALFENDSLKQFMKKGYNYCYISAGINDTYKKMSTTYYSKSIDYIIQFMLTNNIRPIIQEIPDYNIIKSYERQTIKHKIIRRISMFINGTHLDCKQSFRNALNKLIKEKKYKDKVSIIPYKSWNKNYEQDLKEYYNEDQMHLNEKGYTLLDSTIEASIIQQEKDRQ